MKTSKLANIREISRKLTGNPNTVRNDSRKYRGLLELIEKTILKIIEKYKKENGK